MAAVVSAPDCFDNKQLAQAAAVNQSAARYLLPIDLLSRICFTRSETARSSHNKVSFLTQSQFWPHQIKEWERRARQVPRWKSAAASLFFLLLLHLPPYVNDRREMPVPLTWKLINTTDERSFPVVARQNEEKKFKDEEKNVSYSRQNYLEVFCFSYISTGEEKRLEL